MTRPTDEQAVQLGRATWLLGQLRRQMTTQDDGTARIELSPGLVGCLNDFITDEARR